MAKRSNTKNDCAIQNSGFEQAFSELRQSFWHGHDNQVNKLKVGNDCQQDANAKPRRNSGKSEAIIHNKAKKRSRLKALPLPPDSLAARQQALDRIKEGGSSNLLTIRDKKVAPLSVEELIPFIKPLTDEFKLKLARSANSDRIRNAAARLLVYAKLSKVESTISANKTRQFLRSASFDELRQMITTGGELGVSARSILTEKLGDLAKLPTSDLENIAVDWRAYRLSKLINLSGDVTRAVGEAKVISRRAIQILDERLNEELSQQSTLTLEMIVQSGTRSDRRIEIANMLLMKRNQSRTGPIVGSSGSATSLERRRLGDEDFDDAPRPKWV